MNEDGVQETLMIADSQAESPNVNSEDFYISIEEDDRMLYHRLLDSSYFQDDDEHHVDVPDSTADSVNDDDDEANVRSDALLSYFHQDRQQSKAEEHDTITTSLLSTSSSNHHHHPLGNNNSENEEQQLGIHATRRNARNALNFTVFIIHICVALVFGFLGRRLLLVFLPLHKHGTLLSIWTDFSTILTPSAIFTTLPLWIFTYGAQGMFVMAQLVPTFCARPIVQEGTRDYFFFVNIAHMIWIVFFTCLEENVLIYICIAAAASLLELGLLALLLISQYNVLSFTTSAGATVDGRGSRMMLQHGSAVPTSKREYWLLQFPFRVQFGWMCIVAGVNVSMVCFELARRSEHSAVPFLFGVRLETVQLTLNIVIMTLWLLVASLAVIGSVGSRSGGLNLAIPAIISWTFIGICLELRNPRDEIRETFSPVSILTMRAISIVFCVLVGCLSLPSLILRLWQERFTIHVLELE